MASSWQRLGSTTLSSSGDTMDLTITAKDHLKIIIHTIKTGSVDNTSFRFNTDTGNNYTWRVSDGGGSDSTQANYNYLRIPFANADCFSEVRIVNYAGREKLIGMETTVIDTQGAGTAPERTEVVGKWTNTSNQITAVKCWQSGSGSFDTGSTMTIFGTDDDVLGNVYPNLTNGAIFEESDTGKHYMFDGTSAWNEVT